MNENKTIVMLLIIIAILGLALGIKIFFFSDTNFLKINVDQNGTIIQNTTNKTTTAENAIANKTSGYVDSVQQEKENHRELEQEWDSYSNK